MKKDQFWALIDSVNMTVPHDNQNAILFKTSHALCQCELEDLLDFHQIMGMYHKAAYRNDLWAASSALGAHDTDDGFIDFRYWLISRGKQIYMDALNDPDSLAAIEAHKDEFRFELYGGVGRRVFESQYLTDVDGKDGNNLLSKTPGLYERFDAYKLNPQTAEEIQAELPQKPDIAKNWVSKDFSTLFPRIYERNKVALDWKATYKEQMEQILCGYDVICAHVYESKSHKEYMFMNTPENIANFIGSRPLVNKMVLTDRWDCLVLNTVGNFIDQCPNMILLEAIKKTLIPIQMGEAKASDFFCPTKYDVEMFALQKSALEFMGY